MYIYLAEWFCIEQRYIQLVIAESAMKNVVETTLCNFPSITRTYSQEQARFTNIERKCNSQSLFYIFLDSVLHIFTLLNDYVRKNIVSMKNAPLTDKSCFSSMNGSDLEQMSYNRDEILPLEVVEI